MRLVLTLLVIAATLVLTACEPDVDCADDGAGNPAQTHHYCER